MKTWEGIAYIIILILMLAVLISYKQDIKIMQQRYNIVQEEKEYLIKENNELNKKLLEQDSRTNNIDTNEVSWRLEYEGVIREL